MTPNADGPDISHHNPVADWDDIPLYRLFSVKATEGRGFKSPTFDESWRQMRRRGFQFRGAYHWIRSDSPMKDQVENLKRALDAHGGLQTGEFIQLDWETTPGIRNVTVAEVEWWIALAERYWPGRIIVYGSDWVPGFVEWRNKHPEFPVWYANYNLSSKSSGGWAESQKFNSAVWQWTSSHPIPGIADQTCDMNHVWDWDALFRLTATAQEEQMPREYIAAPPPSRPGKPWFLKVNGQVSYATNADDGYPVHGLNEEQYDWLYRSVMGSDTVKVEVTNPTPPCSCGEHPGFPTGLTLTGKIVAE